MGFLESVLNDIIYLAVIGGFVLVVIAGFMRKDIKYVVEKFLEWLKDQFSGGEESE